MLFRKTVFVLALAGAALPAAFANSGTTWSGADGGDHLYAQSISGNSASRSDVKKELAASLKNPVANDPSIWGVGADASSYTFPQHSYAFQGGKLVHTDNIAHDTPKPSRVMPATEQNLFTERYGA